MTAGGGGSKSVVRKERIKSKNEKYKNEKQTESESSSYATNSAGKTGYSNQHLANDEEF